MKRKLLIALLAMAPMGLFAQNETTTSTEINQRKALKQYGFWDNWFIQGQIGGQYTFSENHKIASFTDNLSPTAAVSVGKYFSPQVGGRLQLGGWTSSNYKVDYTYNIKYLNASVDALFNLSNIFLRYKEDRVFNLIGIMGLGYVHGFENSDESWHSTNSISPRIGLQGDFRLNDAWSLNLEANANLLRDDFNGVSGGENYDGTLNVLAGVTYRFKSRGFETVEASDPALIKTLNDKINEQRAQIDDLKACCEKKQTVVEPVVSNTTPVVKNTLNSVIIFGIGKSTIDENQKVNIYNVAQYMKENPDAKVVISSYADKQTGTAQFNQKLSEKRSESVVKVLKEQYGISENRVIVNNNGDKQQPFPNNNDWNRVSIIVSE